MILARATTLPRRTRSVISVFSGAFYTTLSTEYPGKHPIVLVEHDPGLCAGKLRSVAARDRYGAVEYPSVMALRSGSAPRRLKSLIGFNKVDKSSGHTGSRLLRTGLGVEPARA